MPREYEHPHIKPQSAQSESTRRPVLVAQHQGAFPIDTGEYEELFARIQRYWEAEESSNPGIPESLGPSLFDPDDRTQGTISVRLGEAHVDNLFPWGEILPNARKIEVVPPFVNREMRRDQERKKHKKPDVIPKKGTHPKTEKREKPIIRDGQYSFKGNELPNFQEKENGSGQVTRHEKEMKKLANKMAKEMRERAEKAAARQDKADRQPPKEPRKGEYRVVAGKVVPLYPEQNVASRFLAKAKETVGRVVEKLPRDIVPEPLTALQRLTSITTTFIAGSVALVAPFSTRSEGKSAADAAKPSSRPAGIEAQAFNFGKEEAIPSQSEAKKDAAQEEGKLIYPEGVDPYTPETNIQMPEIKGLLRFMTPEDIGEEGKGSNTTPPEERNGRPELIAGINTVAKAYQAKYKDSYLLIGDLNAPDHASHKKGIDVDIYLPNDGLRILKKDDPRREFTKQRAINMGKMLIDTGITDLIFYNDQEVIDEINKYATQKGIDIGVNGIMQKSGDNHNSHMHWRIEKVDRSNFFQPNISIPWMSENVTRWAPYITKYSKIENVDPELIAIIAYIENKGAIGPDTDSDAGAKGPMQVMPSTAVGIAKELGVENYDLRDPETSFRFGIHYIGQLLKEYGKPEQGPSWDMSTLLSSIGYNGGPGAAEGYLQGRVIDKIGPFCESRRYGYYALGMWRERHNPTSKFYDEYNQAINHCKIDPHSFPIQSLV